MGRPLPQRLFGRHPDQHEFPFGPTAYILAAMRNYVIAVLIGLLAAIAIDHFWYDGRYASMISREVGHEIKTILLR
jgi:hypothetical protein